MCIYIYIYIWRLLFCPCVQQRPHVKSEPALKVYFIWVPEVGTSRGHEPIIDQLCGAVIFSPDRANRDLAAGDLPRPIQWIYDPVIPEILANLKSHIYTSIFN